MTTLFTGFTDPQENWSKLPHQLIEAMPLFPGAAKLKVVLYILRHTWGYHDDEKRLTIDEFCHGRKRKDGTRIDSGTGLSEQGVRDGLEAAEKDGFIVVEVDDSDKARIKKYYSLSVAGLQSLGVKTLDPSPKSLGVKPQKFRGRSKKETIRKKPKERNNSRAAKKTAAAKKPALGKKHSEYFAAAFASIDDQSVATLEGTKPKALDDLEAHNFITVDYDGAVIAYWLTPEGEAFWTANKDKPPFAAAQKPLFNAIRDHLNVKGSLPAKFESELKIDYPDVTPEQIQHYAADYHLAFPTFSFPQWNKIATSFGEWVRGEWGRNFLQQHTHEPQKPRKIMRY